MNILKMLADDPNTAIGKPLEFFQAQLGMKKSFLSQKDADAYDRGVRLYQDGEPIPPFGPMSTGWLDAERQEEWRRDIEKEEEDYRREYQERWTA